MKRALFPNETRPDETTFAYETNARITETLVRFGDLTDRGIAFGLQVSLSSATPQRTIDITPGRAYTSAGERIDVLESILEVPLSGAVYTDPSNFGIIIKPNGSYEEGVKNYVLLRYVEVSFGDTRERSRPISQPSRVKASFELEILTEDDYNLLVHSDELIRDRSAVPFPSQDPLPSRSFRVLLAIVTAQGTTAELKTSALQAVDPAATQPESLTGVQISSVTGTTPQGVGVLRYNAGDRTLRWQAPLDVAAGPSVEVPDVVDSGQVILQSATTGFEITVEVSPGSLPVLDTEEPITVVSRLNLTLPRVVNQPMVVSGTAIRKVSTNTRLGTGSISFDASSSELSWKAPGDSFGTGVVAQSDGLYTLRSASTEYFVTVTVVVENLPSDDASEDIVIRGLYDLTIPILSAADRLHRSMVGSGTPSLGNPHATDISDILASSRENPFVTHQDRFHVNGIASDSSSGFLQCIVDEAANTLTPTQVDGGLYIVKGQTFEEILSPDTPVETFNSVDNVTGYYLAYINQEGTFAVTQLTDQVVVTPIVEAASSGEVPGLRIVDIETFVTPTPATSFPINGSILWNAQARTLAWKSPGNSSYGPAQIVKPRMRLEAAGGVNRGYGAIHLELDLVKLNDEDGTVVVPVRLSTASVNSENALKLSSVLWDAAVSQFVVQNDLRLFMTADTTPILLELSRQVADTLGDVQSLPNRHAADRIRMLDNGIMGSYEHSSVYDEDPDAFLVVEEGNEALLRITRPAIDTYAFVNGREVRREHISSVQTEREIDLTTDASDNHVQDSLVDNVVTLYQVYVDEFGRFRHHARVRGDGDFTTKTLTGYYACEISHNFPESTPIVDFFPYSVGTDNVAQLRLSIGGEEFGVASTTDKFGRTRVYAEDGTNWIELFVDPAAIQPSTPLQETLTVEPPLDPKLYLELAQVCYDGSAEIVDIVDKRRFGTVGRRALGTDALEFSKLIRDELHAETHASGVIRGFVLTGVGSSTVDWTGGVAVVRGRRFDVPSGSSTITTTGRRFWNLVMDSRGEVYLSGGLPAMTDRDDVLIAIVYLENTSSTTILYIEDRRTIPAPISRIPGQAYLPVAQRAVDKRVLRLGIDPSNPFGDDGQAAAFCWNVHRTATLPNGSPYYWLDREDQDGLILYAAGSFDPSTVATEQWPYDSSAAHSTFVLVRVSAGENPRLLANAEIIGLGAFPLEFKEGDTVVNPVKVVTFTGGFDLVDDGNGKVTVSLPAGAAASIDVENSGGSVVPEAQRLRFTGNVTVTQDGGDDNRAIVNIPTPSGGSTVQAFGEVTYIGDIEIDGYAGVAIKSFAIPGLNTSQRMNITITTQILVSDPSGSDSPAIVIKLNGSPILEPGWGDQAHESYHPDQRYAQPVFALGNVRCKNGTNTISVSYEARGGHLIGVGRQHIQVLVIG